MWNVSSMLLVIFIAMLRAALWHVKEIIVQFFILINKMAFIAASFGKRPKV